MKRLILIATVLVSLILPSAASAEDGAFTGWIWHSPKMVIDDAWSGSIPRETLSIYSQESGVRIIVRHHRKMDCAWEDNPQAYARMIRPGHVLLCNLRRSPFAAGSTSVWGQTKHRPWTIGRAIVGLYAGKSGNTFCHELGHVFGLDHWYTAPYPPSLDYCVGGNAPIPTQLDRIRLQALYQLHLNPSNPTTLEWLEAAV